MPETLVNHHPDADILLVYWGDKPIKDADGEIVEPFEPFAENQSWYARKATQLTKRRWPKLLPLAEYNRMIEEWLDKGERDELIAHSKLRRDITGEDLSAQASNEDLADQLTYDLDAYVADDTPEAAAAE